MRRPSPPSPPQIHELEKHLLKRFVRGHEAIGDAVAGAEFADRFEVGVETLEVFGPRHGRIDEEILVALAVAKMGRLGEFEIELARIEELEDGDLVTSRCEVADLLFEIFERR